ncbi:enoyl-[acyl-carrier-protein] reductase [Bacillus sp. JCM 19045]|nr:enoyl-[acyl-carrier-protein] reductase [Bacillus sp. JCM 19045]
MDGREIKELIALGASAVQLGTAFLCCPESGASALHKECLQNGSFTETQLTHAYTGRPARGLANPFMQKHEDAPHAYPELHYLTQPIRKKAAQDRNAQVAAMWQASTFSARARCQPVIW